MQHPDLVRVNPSNISINRNEMQTTWNIVVTGLNAGHSIVNVNVTPSDVAE